MDAMSDHRDHIRALAQLIVRLGANVQAGQIVGLGSEPGKEGLARAVAEAAYEQGAKFVDLAVFDVHLKRARALHADPDTLDYVPPWYGDRVRSLGELRSALISLTGPVAPRIMEGIDPALAGKDLLPSVRESIEVLNQRSCNWTVAPCPTSAWAQLVYPDLEPSLGLTRLWGDIAHVCRLDEADPVAAWSSRIEQLEAMAARLSDLNLGEVQLRGPGTELTIALLGSSRWQAARLRTVDGISHLPNLPTEEVFTTPDPIGTEGVVTATKPLFVAGKLVTGLRVRFQEGRAVSIEADEGAETLRTLCARDAGSARLGELALVDREGRIGPLRTVFFDTLLDENAASHIALGQGLEFAVTDEADRQRINASQLHVDFMIGSDEVEVTGKTRDGASVALLRGGIWQL